MLGSRKIFLVLTFFLLLFFNTGVVPTSSFYFSYDLKTHHLKIEIDPAHHFLKAEDRIEIGLDAGGPRIVSFLLHSKLKIKAIMHANTGASIPWSETLLQGSEKKVDLSVAEEKGVLPLSILYEGEIYNPVLKEGGLQFIVGDQTSGIISTEGVYLTSSSHWYPDRPNSMATFKIEAAIREPFRIVTQGELLSEELKQGSWHGVWSYPIPSEGLTLVAGRYAVTTRNVVGVRISTYFFPEDEERYSEMYLDATQEYMSTYTRLLGPFPFKKFDVVQNFFSTGYSFPTFTLLAPEAIRQGKEFLRPGALDHEMVHSWWGHWVGLKRGTGNWLEALTSYCTNYYAVELKEGEEKARDYRRDLLQKYAIMVPPSKDYPLGQFQGKENEADGQIGYGKGSMVFHMLREKVGKDLFFETLRRFSKEFGARQADWMDIRKTFEKSSGKNLEGFLSQWLDRPGGPRLKLENARYSPSPNGYLVSADLVQEGDLYNLAMPVRVSVSDGDVAFLMDVSKRRNSFSGSVRNKPVELSLDPDYNLFRRLYPEEIVPGLNALLERPGKIFVLPEKAGEGRQVYQQLAHMAKEKKGGEVLSSKEVSQEKVMRSSLILFGESWKDPAFARFFSALPEPVRIGGSTFVIGGTRIEGKDESLLLTFHHPFSPGNWVTIYFGNSAAALSRARYIFFYGWDSYIVFKSGRPFFRGQLLPLRSFLVHRFS
jgi:aminopeptidase N